MMTHYQERFGYRSFLMTACCWALFGLLGASSLRADPDPVKRDASGFDPVAQRDSSSDIALLERLSNAYSAIADEVQPSVVSIKAMTINEEVNDELKRMFGDENLQPIPMTGTGSGFIIDDAGYIVTNNHVVEDAGRVQVTLQDGRDFLAEVIGTDKMTDIAVIKISADDLKPCRLGDSDAMRVGNIVLAIGSPFKFGNSVSQGIISAVGRSNVDVKIDYKGWLQTDAPINPGNSGGPLINTRAEVIGMSVAIATESGGYQGVGFAIPSNVIRRIADTLKRGKKVVRGYLGVALRPVNRAVAEAYGLDAAYVALIQGIIDESEDAPAVKAGMQPDDIILKVDDRRVRDVEDLQDLVAQMPPGTKARFNIWRHKRSKVVTVEIGKQPLNFSTQTSRFDPSSQDESDTKEPGSISNSEKPEDKIQSEMGAEYVERLGIYAATLTPELRKRFRTRSEVETGAIITLVDPLGEGFAADLRRGFVIQAVNDDEIESIGDLKRTLENLKDARSARMEVQDGRGVGRVVVRLR